MQLADDPALDYKALVREAYDRCAGAYARQRDSLPARELELVTEATPAGSSILDVGCGAGVPVARHLSDKYQVTGVDVSRSMLQLARVNAPRAHFVQGDVTALDFPAATYDAIVSFYAIFHIPRGEHAGLFQRFAAWLKPSGLLLMTVAEHDDGPGYTEGGFFGETMYWSNFGPDEYRRLLRDAGFTIRSHGILGHGFEAPDVPEERHPFFFAEVHG